MVCVRFGVYVALSLCHCCVCRFRLLWNCFAFYFHRSKHFDFSILYEIILGSIYFPPKLKKARKLPQKLHSKIFFRERKNMYSVRLVQFINCMQSFFNFLLCEKIKLLPYDNVMLINFDRNTIEIFHVCFSLAFFHSVYNI